MTRIARLLERLSDDQFVTVNVGELKEYGQASAREQMTVVLSEIESSTGPTGGWLDSPKALAAAIREKAGL